MGKHDVAGELLGPDADLLLLSHSVEVREVRKDTREADFVFSTDTVDAYGERVEQGSWRLDRYLKNPVVLFAHKSRDLPIGKAKNVGVVDGKLQGTVVFASERANPVAEQVWQSIQEATIRAGSVGFLAHTAKWETEDDKELLILSDCELLEFSITPIPANPDALMRMRQRALDARTPKTTIQPPPAEKRGADHEETTMHDEKELQAATTKANEELGALRKERDEHKTKIEALEVQNKALAEQRDRAVAAAAASDAKLVEREVDALVGKKITPAEKPTFVKLAIKDRALFDELIAQRAESTILKPDPAGMAADPTPRDLSADGDNGQEFAALVNASANS